jgi:pyruvate dehydrogenase E1 component beta subunit
MFDYLDAQIVRIGALNTPIPFTTVLENVVIPNEEDIIKAVKSIA